MAPEGWQVVVSSVGLIGAAVAFLVGLGQYRRAQQWKRAEFLATEMKDLLADSKAANALTMIDWAARRIKLHAVEKSDDDERTVVTYRMQCGALMPHTFIQSGAVESEAESQPSGAAGASADSADGPVLRTYTRDEALIRDCYDALLDRLDRLGGYLERGLMTASDMEPYVGYYINDIAQSTSDATEAFWSVCFLTYVHFYHFNGVPILFQNFEHYISPDGSIFQGFVAAVDPKQRPLAQKLLQAARKEWQSQQLVASNKIKA